MILLIVNDNVNYLGGAINPAHRNEGALRFRTAGAGRFAASPILVACNSQFETALHVWPAG
ncbi:MAG: hypothetical protein ABI790_11585, partial [Betaproteobacteria bacterium]